jgi:hypothetical protein
MSNMYFIFDTDQAQINSAYYSLEKAQHPQETMKTCCRDNNKNKCVEKQGFRNSPSFSKFLKM